MAAKSRHLLKDREVREILASLSARFGDEPRAMLGHEPKIELLELHRATLLLITGRPILFRREGVPFPTLLYEEFLARLPHITVDMGAVPHVCNGADIMSPGVVQVGGEFEAGAIVTVVDERHRRYIALGEALARSSDLQKRDRGKVVRNLHYVGDHVWNAAKNLR